MTIIEMLDRWGEFNLSQSGASQLDFPSRSTCFNTSPTSAYHVLENWEEEIDGKIVQSLNSLIYGDHKYSGILSSNERCAVEYKHVVASIKTNRVNIEDEYLKALEKLTRAMINRGFVVA